MRTNFAGRNAGNRPKAAVGSKQAELWKKLVEFKRMVNTLKF